MQYGEGSCLPASETRRVASAAASPGRLRGRGRLLTMTACHCVCLHQTDRTRTQPVSPAINENAKYVLRRSSCDRLGMCKSASSLCIFISYLLSTCWSITISCSLCRLSDTVTPHNYHRHSDTHHVRRRHEQHVRPSVCHTLVGLLSQNHRAVFTTR